MKANVAWPDQDERRLLSRFYLALGLSRAFYLIYPFEFAYLYLVMDRPEWSVLPLIVMYGMSLVMQLPTGVVADKWGRKPAVLLGAAMASVSYITVPWASRLTNGSQLVAMCGAFAVIGLGRTLMMGAEEAWVVDNLNGSGRADLVEPFFARTYTVTSIGGVVASSLAVTLLLVVHIDRALLDWLWYATAVGFLSAAAVASRIREMRPDEDPIGDSALLPRMRKAIKTVFRIRPLLFLALAMFIANFSGAGADEAFPIALITTGMDARALGPVTIAEDLFGIAAPILALVLARRLGVERLLAVSLIFGAATVTVLFGWVSAPVIIGLWILLGFVDRMWNPVALARLQEDIPSEHRAAIGSLIYQASGVAQLGGLGLLGVMFGSHSTQLREATPDLVDAFTRQASTKVAVPTGLFGLPVPDLAILILVAVSVLAVPFVFLAHRARGRRSGPEHGRTAPEQGRTSTGEASTDANAA